MVKPYSPVSSCDSRCSVSHAASRCLVCTDSVHLAASSSDEGKWKAAVMCVRPGCPWKRIPTYLSDYSIGTLSLSHLRVKLPRRWWRRPRIITRSPCRCVSVIAVVSVQSLMAQLGGRGSGSPSVSPLNALAATAAAVAPPFLHFRLSLALALAH